MNADNRQLLERLADLQGLSAKKKFRLAKSEQEECISVLSILIQSSAENAKKAVTSLPGFPSDIGAVVLAKMWDHLQTQEFSIFQTLRSKKFSSVLCKRLRLALGCQLLSLSPTNAFRVLTNICEDMEPAKKDFPTAKDLNLISTAFLNKGYSLIHKLPLANGPESQVKLLVVYLLAAGFLAKNKGKFICSQEVQLKLLRWTKTFPRLGDIPTEVIRGITTAIRNWSGDYKKIMASEIDTMCVSIRVAVGTAVGAAPAAKHAGDQEAQSTTSAQAQATHSMPQYDPLYEIGRLVDHVKQQDKLFKDTTHKLKQVERDYGFTRSELQIARRDQEELKRQLAIKKESLDEARKEQDLLAKNRDAVVEELNIKKSALTDAENQHKATLQSHEKQLDSLSERVAREGGHRLETFKKKLMLRLQSYGHSLGEAEDMEMTEELGKALRIQLKQILKILKREGINIEGLK